MNNYRRNILAKAGNALDQMKAEMDRLAADEQTGEARGAAERDRRVQDWQKRIGLLQSDVETVRDEEEEAAENTRGEDRKAEMEEAVSELGEFLGDCEELMSLKDLSLFNEMWHSKYDSMCQNLQNAAQ